MKTCFLSRRSAAALLGVLLISIRLNDASGQSLFSGTLIFNTNQPAYGGVPNVFSGQWVAAPFRSGPNPAELDSVTLYEWTITSYGTSRGSFGVSVYADNNGVPGSVLPGGILSGPSAPLGAANQTYVPGQPLSLAANSLYWVVASSDGGTPFDSYGWAAAANTSYTSPAGWNFFNDYAHSGDLGGTWNLQSLGAGIGPQLLAITGIVIPEPTTATLFAAAVAVVAWRRWRISSRLTN